MSIGQRHRLLSERIDHERPRIERGCWQGKTRAATQFPARQVDNLIASIGDFNPLAIHAGLCIRTDGVGEEFRDSQADIFGSILFTAIALTGIPCARGVVW